MIKEILVIVLLLTAMPIVIAAGTGGSTGGTIGVEEFEPLVFQCGNRVLIDDDVQPWRITNSIYPGVCSNVAYSNVAYITQVTCVANGICRATAYANQASCEAAGGRIWVNGICIDPNFPSQSSCTTAGGNWVQIHGHLQVL